MCIFQHNKSIEYPPFAGEDKPSRILVRVFELSQMFSVSRSTIWRWVKEKPGFPQPKKISQGVTVWFAEEVQEWLNNQKQKEVIAMKDK